MNDVDAFWQEQARAREACSTGMGKLVPDADSVGIKGEAEFGRVFRQPVKFNSQYGDGGIDFVIPLRFSVDVKTRRDARDLLVQVGKVVADIYVLAGYDEDTNQTTLLGWETKQAVRAAPLIDLGYGPSHHIAAGDLRPIEELRSRLMELR